MLPISNMPIAYNKTAKANRIIQYIVVHDTGNRGNGANVNSHYNYFNGADRQSSADFFVDSTKIGQFNPDLANYYMWHCGDGGGEYGITNANSIGIEICINADGDYSRAVANAVDLVAYLMKRFGIDLDHVVRHYDASRKNCPQSMNNAGDWSAWNNFKSRVNAVLNNAPQPEQQATATIYSKGSKGSAVKDIQAKLNELGYNCGTPDGDFGNNTYNAVVAFQKAKGLVADGIVGNATLPALNKATAVYYIVPTTDGVNLRESASTSSAILGTANTSNKYKYAGDSGDFYSIYYGEHGAYISKQYSKKING